MTNFIVGKAHLMNKTDPLIDHPTAYNTTSFAIFLNALNLSINKSLRGQGIHGPVCISVQRAVLCCREDCQLCSHIGNCFSSYLIQKIMQKMAVFILQLGQRTAYFHTGELANFISVIFILA
jgi:hypothetical protein